METLEYDLNIVQNTNFSQAFCFKNPEDTTEPLDLTGYTAFSDVKTSVSAESSLIDFTCVVDGSNGKVTISCTPSQTNALDLSLEDAPWFFVWDMVLKSSGNIITRPIKGRVTLWPRISEE